MQYIDIVEQMQRLTEEEREILFDMINSYPIIFKKLLPNELIDQLMLNPHGSDHPLINHFQIWKNNQNS